MRSSRFSPPRRNRESIVAAPPPRFADAAPLWASSRRIHPGLVSVEHIQVEADLAQTHPGQSRSCPGRPIPARRQGQTLNRVGRRAAISTPPFGVGCPARWVHFYTADPPQEAYSRGRSARPSTSDKLGLLAASLCLSAGRTYARFKNTLQGAPLGLLFGSPAPVGQPSRQMLRRPPRRRRPFLNTLSALRCKTLPPPFIDKTPHKGAPPSRGETGHFGDRATTDYPPKAFRCDPIDLNGSRCSQLHEHAKP